jgi:hypothetical protein
MNAVSFKHLFKNASYLLCKVTNRLHKMMATKNTLKCKFKKRKHAHLRRLDQ